MKTTNLGPLTISIMQLGAMYFGTATDEQIAHNLLDAFTEKGGNFIDTSNNYAFWSKGGTGAESETVLGHWLKNRGQRDDVMIATKVGAQPSFPGAELEDVQGLSASVIIQNIDESLKRLQTDYIDLYYAHVDNRATPLEETLGAFDKLVKSGKVRAIACSNYVPWRLEEARHISRANGFVEYAAVQARHSYFQPRHNADFGIQSRLGPGDFGIEHSADTHLFDYAHNREGFRITAYSPLLQGGYTNPEKLRDLYQTPDNEKRRMVLEAVAGETGASINQIVLAWMMQSDPSIIPLVAASSLAQLEENIAAADVQLTSEQLHRLNNPV